MDIMIQNMEGVQLQQTMVQMLQGATRKSKKVGITWNCLCSITS
jgi:hypothetical protein